MRRVTQTILKVAAAVVATGFITPASGEPADARVVQLDAAVQALPGTTQLAVVLPSVSQSWRDLAGAGRRVQVEPFLPPQARALLAGPPPLPWLNNPAARAWRIAPADPPGWYDITLSPASPWSRADPGPAQDRRLKVLAELPNGNAVARLGPFDVTASSAAALAYRPLDHAELQAWRETLGQARWDELATASLILLASPAGLDTAGSTLDAIVPTLPPVLRPYLTELSRKLESGTLAVMGVWIHNEVISVHGVVMLPSKAKPTPSDPPGIQLRNHHAQRFTPNADWRGSSPMLSLRVQHPSALAKLGPGFRAAQELDATWYAPSMASLLTQGPWRGRLAVRYDAQNAAQQATAHWTREIEQWRGRLLWLGQKRGQDPGLAVRLRGDHTDLVVADPPEGQDQGDAPAARNAGTWAVTLDVPDEQVNHFDIPTMVLAGARWSGRWQRDQNQVVVSLGSDERLIAPCVAASQPAATKPNAAVPVINLDLHPAGLAELFNLYLPLSPWRVNIEHDPTLPPARVTLRPVEGALYFSVILDERTAAWALRQTTSLQEANLPQASAVSRNAPTPHLTSRTPHVTDLARELP